MILLLDNYDSFTFNVADLLAKLGAEVRVFRNDAISVEEAERLRPSRLVISPGPGRPEDSGVTLALLRRFAGRIPILGVCLGHQAIACAFGGEVVRAGKPMHGKTSRIHHTGEGVFRGLPNPFAATRYHSLAVRRKSLPASLEVTAEAEDGEVMGLRHKELPIEGVQFHPESILTPDGWRILANFLRVPVPTA